MLDAVLVVVRVGLSAQVSDVVGNESQIKILKNNKMTKEKLSQANQLEKQINEFESANKCFWFSESTLKSDGSRYSTNPQLLIEFDNHDGDGRDTIKLPMVLSDDFIEFMQDVIDGKIAELKNEFDNL